MSNVAGLIFSTCALFSSCVTSGVSLIFWTHIQFSEFINVLKWFTLVCASMLGWLVCHIDSNLLSRSLPPSSKGINNCFFSFLW